jgi:PAS domain S-box-containing protein
VKQILAYAGLVLAALAARVLLEDLQWQRSAELHTLLEVVAGLLALMLTKMALVRHYSRRSDRFLLLGVAFLGTGLLDIFHGLASSPMVGEVPPGLMTLAAQSWGWIASRLFLAIFLLGACIATRMCDEEEGRLNQRAVYLGAGGLIAGFFLLLAFAPLPASYLMSLSARRGLELLPAALFLLMLGSSLRRGTWRSGGFDHWMVLSLLAGFLGQALFMAFARGPADPLVVAGHLAKIFSYLFVLFGLLGDMYSLYRHADRTAAELAHTNVALQAEAHGRSRAEEDRNRFFDLSLDLLSIAGADGYFRQLSPAWEQTLGWTTEELKARPYVDFVHPEDRQVTDRESQLLRLGGTVVDFENRYATRDGGWRWLSWRAVAVPEKGLIYGVARDISERKRVEQMKNDFISVVSHELRTPLTSIRGSLGLISGGVAGELPEKARILVDIASKNSDRLVRLINDILDVEKIESGQMGFRLVPQDLMALVEQAVEANQPYGQPYGISLRIVDSVRVLVRADADRMQQVLTNLLSNAMKFSPRSGVVEVGVTAENGKARLRVTDHGKGIPPEFQEHIFEKFAQADATSTRQQGGTGLGLSISRAIVERHGGSIWFESVAGQGTTFFVELPEWMAEPAPAPASGRDRILVCEDDPDIAKLLVLMLQQDGYDVDIAHDAAEARRWLTQRRYSAMTLDLILPGQDGLSLLRELREDAASRHLPVVVVSARAEEGRDQLNGGAIGVIDWLIKPIDQDRLMDAVRNAARGATSERPRILHVEDDVDLRRVVAAILERAAEVTHAQDLAEAREKLNRQKFDLVVLDLALPDGSGVELLPHLGTLSPPTPVIIFSAHEVDGPIAARVASVLVKSQTSNRDLLEKIQGVLRRVGEVRT